MDHQHVDRWLAAYVAAWKSYERDAIGALFSDDARCWYHPFDEPVVGRDAIVESWLGDAKDPSGTYDGDYHCLVVEGDTAVTQGRSSYFTDDGSIDKRYDNIFVLRFDENGNCREFREWYMQSRPRA